MDKFEFFFAFYSLLLGLAVTELLGNFGAFVRVRATKNLDPRTMLLALFAFVAICATWIDAWSKLQGVTIDFAGLWVPILIATFYYLAATTIFPPDPAGTASAPDDYDSRKRFAIAMIIAAEIGACWVYYPTYVKTLTTSPAGFWLFHLPYKVALLGLMAALLVLRNRTAEIACLVILTLLFLVPYWAFGWISRVIASAYGYAS
ncbi:hypothetical protein P1X14_00480 [Sphingomonas sp. AOB5]|uniref:hypothetical protein n=1 Tax=Sphingomonas sp. AOB5 TaxID=3034017 RepID=UPI0023F6898D|nr:hypothetical protein [Sphingomonas sp. AOB5]MDF7773707.1 hypothetical protein [Sphingomonas sp. AOB5]